MSEVPTSLVKRHFTNEGNDVYNLFRYKTTDVAITDYFTGKPVFELMNVEVPETYSDSATSICASRYFRLAGVPGSSDGKEHSIKQLVKRITDTIAFEGVKQGYLSNDEGVQFKDELAYLMLDQRMCPNSPVLFNMGLAHVYGIHDPSEDGCSYWDTASNRVLKAETKYDHPQVSACFINHVADKMMSDESDDGIFNIVNREARLFKYGSGAGANWSTLRERGAKLSSGGTSSGLMSFLKIPDRSADCVKSGGTTRRAARMVGVDIDHPEIYDFVDWKAHEEDKALLLLTQYPIEEVKSTISGQNGNNSVRVTEEFMRAVYEDSTFDMRSRILRDANGRPAVVRTEKARDLYQRICEAAWKCGDPGIQFDTTINDWHTCPNSGRINASNPCSEFMFLDDSACNLASINLGRYMGEDGRFDIEGFKHTVRLTTLAQDIIIDMASYPDKRIAENSHRFRPLGLGFANAGGLLMSQGIPYDSDRGRSLIGAISALMTGEAYAQSIDIAKKVGTFIDYQPNREPMLHVMAKHTAKLEELLHTNESTDLVREARKSWDYVVNEGEQHGFRNTQTTLLAPTGTISFFMNCDTTGIEPGLNLIQHKKLAGGGRVNLFNMSVAKGLKRLGYTSDQVKEIETYVLNPNKGHGSVVGAPYLKQEHYSIFDCAFEAGPTEGKRFLSVDAHIKMMAAAQPFVSGAISKTVNMPHNSTLDDIADAYSLAHKLGLKSIAIYRDKSKVEQPVDANITETCEAKLSRGERHRLPPLRLGITKKVMIHGESVIIRTGEYENGDLGEIFINMKRQEETARDFLDELAIQASYRLQEGASLERIVKDWIGIPDSTGGLVTGDDYIKSARSILDYIAKFIAGHYLGDTSSWHIQPADKLELRKHKLKAMAPFERYLDEMKKRVPTRRSNGRRNSLLINSAEQQTTAHTSSSDTESHFENSQGNTPLCSNCHGQTHKAGTCYVCNTCGTTTGCS